MGHGENPSNYILSDAISVATTAAASIAASTSFSATPHPPLLHSPYESQKRRDWNYFGLYLRSQQPPLSLSLCTGAHVLEFLRHLDHFGKTKVHGQECPFFGTPNPPYPCPCPLRQSWGSLDALVGRLRAAYQEHGGLPPTNPFNATAVRLHRREVRDYQARARGVSFKKNKKKRPPTQK